MKKYIYNEKSGNLYILIYKLGEGTSGIVYYSICINLKSKELKISSKAVKIMKNKIFYKKETKILDFDISNKSHILGVYDHCCDDNNIYIVTEVMMANMFDVFRLMNYDLEENMKKNVLEQIKKGIEELHSFGYYHYDVKSENFLLKGQTKKQREILDIAKNYDFGKIRKEKKREAIITEFIENLDLDDYTMSDEDDISDDEEDNDSCYEGASNGSYMTDENTFVSGKYEFGLIYDKFFVEDVIALEMEDDDEEDEKTIYSVASGVNADEVCEVMLGGNFEIMICDFGLMKNIDKEITCCPRLYRHPMNILGEKISGVEIDMWAYKILEHELNNGGRPYVRIKDDCHFGIYNNDLISIKMLYEKVDDREDLYEKVQKSKRRDYILCDDGSFLFYRNLNK